MRQAADAVMAISWRSVAILGWLSATSTSIALVLVVSLSSDVDALSTTALALAVLAFGAQLIVYVAQVGDSTSMRRQAADINASTQASLAQITAKVDSSDKLLRDQNRQLLDTLLSGLRATANISKEAGQTFEGSDVVRYFEDALEDGLAPTSVQMVSRLSDSTVLRLQALREWPETIELAEQANLLIEDLHAIAIGQLIRLAEDWINSVSLDGVQVGLLFSNRERSPYTADLLDRGLAERTGVEHRPDGKIAEYVTLSDKGHLASRLLLPQKEAPPYVKSLLQA